jgi:16S rRNA (cytosine967-C5)-methyltransferase
MPSSEPPIKEGAEVRRRRRRASPEASEGGAQDAEAKPAEPVAPASGEPGKARGRAFARGGAGPRIRMTGRADGPRELAMRVLVRVERDRAYADLTLHAELPRAALARRDRALATELCYGTLRMRGRLDAALAQVLTRPLADLEPAPRNLLRIAAYQILGQGGSVPPPLLVSETVDLARKLGIDRAAGLLNAVLRQLVKRKDTLEYPSFASDPVGHLRDYCSLPQWLAERWLAELGPTEARALALASLRRAPSTVRLSAGADRKAIMKRLGGNACTFAPDGLTDLERDPIGDPAFADGELTVQDEASQLVPLLVGARPGDRVVDCCAAPGTKTVQLAQQVGAYGEVIALDRNEARLALIRQAAHRLRLKNVRALARDVRHGFDLQGQMQFRAILVDAPCSGLGTLRRNPDARWLLDPSSIARNAELAGELLDSAARYVEPGGALVYSVCTITPEETHGVVDAFLERSGKFRRDHARPWLPPAAARLVNAQGALATLPHRDGCDGFFAQRLMRT